MRSAVPTRGLLQTNPISLAISTSKLTNRPIRNISSGFARIDPILESKIRSVQLNETHPEPNLSPCLHGSGATLFARFTRLPSDSIKSLQ